MDEDQIELALRPTAAKTAAPVAPEVDPIEQALNPATQKAPMARREPIVVPESPYQGSLAGKAVKGVLDVAGGLGETIAGGALGLAGQAAGSAASYAGRFLPGGDWERAQKWADEVAQQVSTVGGLYKGAETATGKAIESGMEWLGGKVSQAAGAVGQKTLETTGSPALASTVDAAVQALPQIAGAKLVQRFRAPAEATPAAGMQGAALAPESITKAPAAAGQAVVGGFSDPELALAIKKSAPTIETSATPLPEATEHAATDLPQQTINDRAAVLARVGHQSARTSAVTGNGPATMFDYDSAKSPDPAGQMMRQQIDAETAANAGFADKIRQQTGGSSGLDQTSLYQRGSVLDNAWSALRQWHENAVKSQYDEARTALGDAPVKLDTLAQVAPDPAKVSGTTQGIAFKNQLDRVMQSLGIADKDGNVLPSSVNSAERLRQWMNASWTPETAGFISELKNALDTDVTQAAGEDVFAKAREARTHQARTLDANKAISRVFDSNGANRAVPIEGMPDAIARLPSDQLAHVANVFGNMPEGLQPLGTAALNEIAAHFANRIVEAGTPRSVGGAWSDIGVSKYLANNNARLAQVFTPEGMQMIGDLNQAGKITAMDKRYVGAAGQSQNFLQRGLIYGLPRAGGAAGAALGGFFGGPLAAAGGAGVGESAAASMANRMQQAFSRKQMQERIQPLSQPTK